MTAVPLIPTEDFFDSPVASNASISPDGRRIAYLAPEKGRMNVWVRDVDAAEAVCVTHDHNRGIPGYQWTDDPRWLLFSQDRDGDENWHVFRVDLDDPEADPVDLTPIPGVYAAGVELPAGLPGTAYVLMNAREPSELDVHSIDIATGELALVAQNPGHVGDWFWGRQGELFAMVIPPGGGWQVHAWDADAAELRLITTYDGADLPMGVFPIEVTPDGTGIWLGSYRDSDLRRLVRLDVATGEETLVDSHPELEPDLRGSVSPLYEVPLIISQRTGEVLGVRYLGERQVIQALDPHFADVLEGLSKLSDGDLKSISSDDSERHWVVSFTHDTDPGVTYRYDHQTGESELLFHPHPHLDPDVLAPMQPVTVTSRDGLPLQCYLTVPVGVDAVDLPLVVVLHGGPWYRDGWDYDPRIQFLANRGYAVLQVNMRGSIGFGKAFTRAAIGEFAGTMHDDVIDAVEWAVDAGYADRQRVGIYGRSYGGYATLVGVTFTPDVFAAAVDDCGMSSLATLIRSFPPYVRHGIGNNWYTYVGDPDDPADYADMIARSPISRVDDIVTPLLVIQGANDVRVLQAESDAIVDALRARDAEVEYLVKDDEGHGYRNPENLIEMFNTMERFLGRHLGGRTAQGDPFSSSESIKETA